jgi:hypothetical protein
MTAATPRASDLRAERIRTRASELAKRTGRSELGILDAEIRNLCAEIQAYAPDVDRALHRFETMLDGRIPVAVGYEWDGSARVCEVWIAGNECIDVLSKGCLKALADDIEVYHVPDENPDHDFDDPTECGYTGSVA